MEDIIKIAVAIWETKDVWLPAVLSIVGGAAVLAKYTPTLKDDHALAKLTRLIDWLGQNDGYAKNDPKDQK